MRFSPAQRRERTDPASADQSALKRTRERPMARRSQVALLTGGGDRPYALGLAGSLVDAGVPVRLHRQRLPRSAELRRSPQVRFLNLRGDVRPDAPLLHKACASSATTPADRLRGWRRAADLPHPVEQQAGVHSTGRCCCCSTGCSANASSSPCTTSTRRSAMAATARSTADAAHPVPPGPPPVRAHRGDEAANCRTSSACRSAGSA